jgi:predicted Zn-dependent protease
MARPVGFSVDHPVTVSVRADADVLRVIGFLLLQHGKSSEAATLFDALRVLAPTDPKVVLSLALAWLQVGNPQAAYDVLDSIQASESKDADLLSLTRDPVFYWLQSQALSGLGRTSDAARSARLFLRLRREFELQMTK